MFDVLRRNHSVSPKRRLSQSSDLTHDPGLSLSERIGIRSRTIGSGLDRPSGLVCVERGPDQPKDYASV
jgi:hypothetical protein